MMVGAVNMGRRRAIVDVVVDVLLINRRNFFGIKCQQWTRAELESLTVGPSGMEVNAANSACSPAATETNSGGSPGLRGRLWEQSFQEPD